MSTAHSTDAQAFHDFEHAGWQNGARAYHASWTRLTSQAVEPLLDAAHVARGLRVLDVATGPGQLAAAAAERGADVSAIDFADAMLTQAHAQYPHIQFEAGDAEALPFPPLSFDAVVIAFGMLHFARPEIALVEAHRVLRASGRVAFSVWSTPDQAIGFRIVYDAIQTHGNMDVPLLAGPPFFRFSDHEQCRLVLRESGFANPQVAEIPLTWQLPLPDGLFDAYYFGTVRTGPLLRTQTPDALSAIREAMRKASLEYACGDHIAVPMACVLASGVK